MACDKLAKQNPPLGRRQVLSDAPGRELVVGKASHAVRHVAHQHVDDVLSAEADAARLANAVDAGDELFGGHRHVEEVGRLEAVVAVTAGLGLFAEVGQKPLPSTVGRLGQTEHGIELLRTELLVHLVRITRIDEEALVDDVVEAVGHPGVGGLAVASRAPRFLKVAFDRLGHVHVRHEAHVRLVDAHAEGDGRHHHDAVLTQEHCLIASPLLCGKARMIGQRLDTAAREVLRNLLGRAAGQAVDDAAVTRMLVLDEVEELLLDVALVDDAVEDVRPVKARHELPGVVEKLSDDLRPRLLVGRGRERNAGNLRIAGPQQLQLSVLGTEVMSPDAHAVRLVNGEERDVDPVEQREHRTHHQALGRHVEQIQPARQKLVLHSGGLLGRERRVEIGRLHADFVQRIDLILHEGDQGGDHDGHAVAQQRGNLITEALATACRHQHQSVPARHDGFNHLLLKAPEGLVAENLI